MKQAEDTKTRELPGVTKRGRKPLGDRPMTAAERQRAYRERLAQERYEYDTSEVSRVTLIRQLVDCLDQLDRRPPDPDLNEGAQYRAAEILAELVTRYKLDVSQVRRFKAKRGFRI